MSKDALLAAVLAEQAPSGAFLSTVDLGEVQVTDENGFVTALVLRELAYGPEAPLPLAAQQRAVEFLRRCESRERPGVFGFYPPGRHPGWMGGGISADADDSALYAVTLFHCGEVDAGFLRQVAAELAPCRRHHRPESAPPWFRPGVYRTWLSPHERSNLIDCCVNVNVAALLYCAGVAPGLGFTEILAMLEAGLDWAGASEERARKLSPFYPDPWELFRAVERAVVDSGVAELADALDRMGALPWVQRGREEGWRENRPLCSSDDGRIRWTSRALERARRLRAGS